MFSSKYHQSHLKLHPWMRKDPPLYFCGTSNFQTKTDALGSLHEECFVVGSLACHTKYSSKPHDEFYASMTEMVIYKLECDLSVDWDYMEVLLVCYLELNEKKVHKYIFRAFYDVMEVLNVE